MTEQLKTQESVRPWRGPASFLVDRRCNILHADEGGHKLLGADRPLREVLPDELLERIESACRDGKAEPGETLTSVLHGDELVDVSVNLDPVALESEQLLMVSIRRSIPHERMPPGWPALLEVVAEIMRGSLGAATTTLDLLHRVGPDQVPAETISAGRNSSRAGLRMLADIIDLFRIDAREARPVGDALDPVSLVEGTIIARSSQIQSNVEYISEVHADLPRNYLGDAGRVAKLLRRLVSLVSLGSSPQRVLLGALNPRGAPNTRVRFVLRFDGKPLADPILAALCGTVDYRLAGDSAEGRRLGVTTIYCRRLTDLLGGRISYTRHARVHTLSVTLDFAIEGDHPVSLKSELADVAGMRVHLLEPDTARRLSFQRQARDFGLDCRIYESAAAAAADDCEPPDLILINQRTVDYSQSLSLVSRLAPVVLVPIGDAPRPVPGCDERGVRWINSPMQRRVLIDLLHEKPISELQKADDPTEDHRGETPWVLIVDDSPETRLVLSAIVKQLGGAPVTASSGLLAVQAAAAREFEAGLIDLNMPELSGFDTAARIRALPGAHGKFPLFAVSGGVGEGERQSCEAAGFDDYLSKPVSVRDLERALERWFPSGLRQTARPSAELLNQAVLQELSQTLSHDQIQNLLHRFASEAQLRYKEASDALRDENIDLAAIKAHALKSAAHSFGCTFLAKAAEAVEIAARERQLHDVTNLLAGLRSALEQTLIALREERGVGHEESG